MSGLRQLLTLVLFLEGGITLGQNTFYGIVRDSATLEPLAGATLIVEGTLLGAISGNDGKIELSNIPDGRQILNFRFLGYSKFSDTIVFPLEPGDIRTILMERESHEIEEVFISSTRSTRTIENIPTRVEFIAGEELDEKGNMKPGDIRMMLNESTGIQTQQTSATSFNSSIRIQGLDGRYTQLLRDGFPLYQGYSGGLSLLQIVPLDLSQVEVIKGASSTLYGGGAIAGLVNLITRTPGKEKTLNFLLNGTTALGFDASGFYSQKFEKAGTTLFASYNSGNAYDPSGTGLTAIPEFNRFTLNPRLFLYPNNNAVLSFGVNSTFELRTGGDIQYIKGKSSDLNSWYEKNRTTRVSTQLSFETNLGESTMLILKNSIGFYDRTLEIPGFLFGGIQTSSFSEAAITIEGERLEWTAGLNFVTDRFSQEKEGDPGFDYNNITGGGFAQNIWNISGKFSIETGLRIDIQDDYGLFALPRISVLLKPTESLAFRAGGGLGYKIPTIFTEEAERIHFENIKPLNISGLKAERSAGGNFDINFRRSLSDKLFFSINSLLFYTRINSHIILSPASLAGEYEFLQPEGFIDTKGIETNIRISYGDLKLFLGHTLADVNEHHAGEVSGYPLVAKHRLNNVLMYENEERFRVGLEAYYFSRQKLNDNTMGRDYWIFGIMIERIREKISLFLNFENITDTRQTRFDTIFDGPVTNPVFRDIYAPLDGFIVNGGCKIRIF